eukprot:3446464-Pyramimonas_sp.AAC.1
MKEAAQNVWSQGLQGDRFMPALASFHDGRSEITRMLGTRVDDRLRAADDDSQKIIDSVLAELDTREIKLDSYGSCR